MPRVGHNPIPPRRGGITIDQASYRLARATGADSETFHLLRAREAYARNLLDLDALERAIAHVLRGGYLDENFVLRTPIMDRVRQRRLQRECAHDRVYEFMAAGHAEPIQLICARCGGEPGRDRRRRELGAAGSASR